ncbi:MAG: hypothetical protein Kow0025_14640 [Thermodesulfovibrionales bacterium]
MRRDISVFLFVLGLLLFNWPLMGIFKSGGVSLYLFISWAVFIGLVFVTASLSGKEDSGGG